MGEAKEFYEGYWTRRLQTAEDPFLQTRYDLVMEALVGLLPVGARVLDCGSGHGALVGQLAAAGYDVEGIEIAETAVTTAQRRFPGSAFHCHSIEKRPWPVAPNSFDAAVSLEVIEHLLRPRELLLGMHEALRPNGRIAISTPYHGRLKSMMLAVDGFDRHFDVEGPHLRFFTDRALVGLVKEVGFHPLSVRHYGRLPLIQAGTFLWASRT